MTDILKALESTEESDRLYAVQDIMELNHEADKYAEVLVAHLGAETSQAVRDSMVYALKRMACTKAFPMLFDLFMSSDAYLRNAAVTIFGTKETRGVAFLTSQLDHADREVRKLVLDALFHIGTRDAVLAIRAGLHDPSINVRITAVEYIGQLGDHESMEDVFDMLENETDPMLITSALETVLQLGDDGAIARTIEFLNKNDDILKVHPVFLPELVKLTARIGSVESLMELIVLLNGRPTYAKDIVSALEEAIKRHGDIISHPGIESRLMDIVGNSSVGDGIRYAAAELILSRDPRHDLKALYELGIQLVDEPSMVHAGVRLLATTGSEAGRDRIRRIMETTRDTNLVRLCEELIT
ncbi:MAG: HEAT repeat domain-containing protein [Desulfamplus sp.]|nr:HEAT repeat domain-containing protein [Desulfamplus sp.]